MVEVTLRLDESQVIELTQQLSPKGRRAVLRRLIPDLDQFEDLVDYGAERVRTVAEGRGIDWDNLSEEDRQQLIDDLLHEDR